MNKLHLFVPITKVDEARQEVWGRVAEEVVDKDGEIMDYATSKPYFEAWSGEFKKVTNGLSKGNVRAMHGKVAAGKVISIDYGDSEKVIDVGTKIVDEIEFGKCAEGVYTGFSVGGAYVKRWKDGHAVRYTVDPAEISLVDNPCMPGARFSVVKASGVTEERKPHGGISQVWTCSDTGRHLHTEKAAALDCMSKLTGITVRKDIYTVAEACSLLHHMNAIRIQAKAEADRRQDGSAIPELLAQEIRDFSEIALQMLEEETGELLADLDKVAAMAPAEYQKFLEDLTARFSGVQINDARAIVERALKSLPEPEDEEMDEATIQKLVSASTEKAVVEMQKQFDATVEKAVSAKLAEMDLPGLKKSIDETKAAQEELGKQISEDVVKAVSLLTDTVADLEKRTPKASDPAPAKGSLRAVSKAEDNGGEAVDVSKLEGAAKTDYLLKEAFARPIPVRPGSPA